MQMITTFLITTNSSKSEQKLKMQHFFSFVKGHNSKTANMMPLKFKFDMCFV